MDPETGSRNARLTSGQDTWSARCAETCTSGAAGGPGKPTGSNPDRAPRSDPTDPAEQLSVSDAGNRPRLSRVTDRKASAATSSDDISLTDNPPPASKDTHDRHLALVTARVCL